MDITQKYLVIHPSYLKSYLVDITLKHLRWLPCLCPPKPSTSFAWPPGDVHQWSFSRSALKGGNHLFSKGSLFLRGLPCPREKQHLFYKEFLLILKTPLQAFFPKAATFLLWPPSDFFSNCCLFCKGCWFALLSCCLFCKGYSCWHSSQSSTKSATAATKSGYTWIPCFLAHWCLSQ